MLSLVGAPSAVVLLAVLIMLTLADLYLTATGSDGARARGFRIIENQVGAIASIDRIERKLDDMMSARIGRDRLPAEAVCPPYWKCNGRAETNDAGCACWDKY